MTSKRLLLGLSLLLVSWGAWAGPRIAHWQTANGAQVYFVPARELPMVDVQVVFDAGGARDGDRAGIARMTNGMLAEGAGGRSADAIAERFSTLGARFDNASLRDMANVTLRVLSEETSLQPAVGLVATLLARPDFPADALERVRAQMQVSLEHIKQSPSRKSRQAFFKALYPGHPYGQPPEGTPATVAALTAADLREYHRRFYVAKNAVVSIVGDLDREGAEALARTLVGGLPAGEHAPPLPPAPLPDVARTIRVSHPSAQTHLRMGQPGMDRLDPDYFPLYVGNHILGGSGLVSLLSEEVREKRGLSYSVYSAFVPMRSEGPFTLALETRNDKTIEALKVSREVLDRFIREGPTEKQLEDAKRNITGGFPLRLDSNRKILEHLTLIGFYGLPLDYLDTFTDRVQAVTREQVRDVFARRVHPDRFITVLVGPEAGHGS